MKLIKKTKAIWKDNKWAFLISCIVLTFGCYLTYARIDSPMVYSLPLGISGMFIMMFGFGLFLGGDE